MRLAELLINEVRGEPLFRDSLDDPLPFDSSYQTSDEEPGEYAGTYRFRMGEAVVAPNQRGLTITTPSRLETLQVGPDEFLGRSGAEPIYFMRDEAGAIRGFTHIGYYYPRSGA